MTKRSTTSFFKFLLLPFAALYGLVVLIRNFGFVTKTLKSNTFPIPVIAVGNLSVGGTGKSPQIEYLIKLLKGNKKVAVLSRGYKRVSEGFILANENTKMPELGDEPFQFFTNHPEVLVAVDADRTNGINTLLELHPDIDVILLDDAFQHRKVKASFYTLLTSYDSIYPNDFLLPVGGLRESRSGAKRANVIVVTKCPDDLSAKEQNEIIEKIAPEKKQKVFFTKIEYAKGIISSKHKMLLSELKKYEVVLVTGIANPNPLLSFLETQEVKYTHMKFPDHYNFNASDLKNITEKLAKINSKEKLILTTEKDFMRLKSKLSPLYYLPIETKFLNDSSIDFDAQIEKVLV